jgi:hypothetical protein
MTTRDDQPQTDALREALIKVRAHTSYAILPDPQMGELLRGLLASIERIVDAALRAPAPQDTRCVIGDYCSRHGFVHGAEAEELRERLAALKSRKVDAVLEDVDARDSLAYVESQDTKEGR